MLVFSFVWTSASSASSSSSRPVSAPAILLQWCLLLTVIPFASAEPRNFTIDDTLGDELSGARVVYGGQNVEWRARSREQVCGMCLINPDSEKMKEGTWHEATTNIPATIDFKFNGTALYIFCALAGATGNDITTESHLTLTIDDTIVVNFDWEEVFASPVQYNVPVLSASGLDPTREHTATVLSEPRIGLSGNSLIMFDYALYTVEQSTVVTPEITPAPTPAPASSSGLKLGLGLGLGLGLAATIILLLIIFQTSRCRRRNRDFVTVELGDSQRLNMISSTALVEAFHPIRPSGWVGIVVPGRTDQRKEKEQLATPQGIQPPPQYREHV